MKPTTRWLAAPLVGTVLSLSACAAGDDQLVEDIKTGWDMEYLHLGPYAVTDFTTGGKAEHVRLVMDTTGQPSPEQRADLYCAMAAKLEEYTQREWRTIDVVEEGTGRVLLECKPYGQP